MDMLNINLTKKKNNSDDIIEENIVLWLETT